MKKIKKEVKFAYQSDYYFPGPKYAEKLIKKEEKFRKKIRELRWDDIHKQNCKFDLNNADNIARLLRTSDISYPFYCMVEEHKLSFSEAMNLTENDFNWEVKIELDYAPNPILRLAPLSSSSHCCFFSSCIFLSSSMM